MSTKIKQFSKAYLANLQLCLFIEFCICFVMSLAVLKFAPCISKGSLVLSILFGEILAVSSGTVFVVPLQIIMRLRASVPWGEGEPKTASILGYVERALVFSACVINNGPIVIAGWIALKSISHWKGWEKDPENKDNHDNLVKGRARFNIFLVGTALSIMAAIASALFSLWLYNPSKICEIFTFGVPTKAN